MGLRVVRCRSVIILVINKLDSRFAVVQFCNHSYDYRPNRTPLSPITIIYYPSQPWRWCLLPFQFVCRRWLVSDAAVPPGVPRLASGGAGSARPAHSRPTGANDCLSHSKTFTERGQCLAFSVESLQRRPSWFGLMFKARRGRLLDTAVWMCLPTVTRR